MREQQPLPHFMNETDSEKIKRLEIMVNFYRSELAKEKRKNHELQKQQPQPCSHYNAITEKARNGQRFRVCLDCGAEYHGGGYAAKTGWIERERTT